MSDLPYTDTKPVGAADFYEAINRTFRFMLARLGRDGWIGYLEDMGRRYFDPVNASWRNGGLPVVAKYWRSFFAAEPGAEVEVTEAADRVELNVRVCPAIRQLRTSGHAIVGEYCEHCYHLGEARAKVAGLAMRLEGGNGSCRHTYFAASVSPAPQDLSRIARAQ